jgi:hypothetical protein
MSLPSFILTAIASAVGKTIEDLRMMVGGNLPHIYTYGGLHPFVNALLSMTEWNRITGTGSFTQVNGKLTASVPTDRFRAYLSNGGSAMPVGTYTVFNPDGCKVALGGFNDPGTASYTTATQFTYNYTGGFLAFWCEGSFTSETGRCAVLPPYSADVVQRWQSGNIWRQDFLDYLIGLKLKTIRFMDALGATYANIESDWSDRTPENCISICNSNSWTGSGFGNTMSWEMICDLCNRVGSEPLLSLPVRLTDTYIQNMAALMHSRLNPGKKIWVEYGNEIWNPGNAYVEARTWVTRLTFTKNTAIANFADQSFTKENHGLTNGAIICCFPSKAQRSVRSESRWPYVTGGLLTVIPLTSNTFRAYTTVNKTVSVSRSGTTLTVTYSEPHNASSGFYVDLTSATSEFNLRGVCTQVNNTVLTLQVPDAGPTSGSAVANVQPNIVSTMPDLLYTVENEAGKTLDLDGNHGRRSKEVWDIIVAMSPGRTINKVLGTWGTDPNTTQRRLAPPGVAESTDYLAIADYWAGTNIHGWGMNVVSGVCTPLVYSRVPNFDVYVSVFPAGTTVNRSKVINGTGALYTSTRKTASVASTYDQFTSTSALTVGTTYEFGFVFVDMYGWQHLTTSTVTLSEGSTYINPTMSTEQLSNKISIFYSLDTVVGRTNSTGQGIPLMCYEGGSDYYGSHPTPLSNWINNQWLESPENGQIVAFNLRMCSAFGIKAFNQYTVADNAVWGWSNGWSDTSDNRYQSALTFAGRVPVGQLPPYGDLLLNAIESKPLSFPYFIHQLDTSCTHTIVQGNDEGWFSINNNSELVMINDTNMNWSIVNRIKLGVMSERDGLATFRKIEFILSSSWYDAGSWLAWSPLNDSDTVEVNPVVGAVMPRSYGSTYATIKPNNFWDIDGVRYASLGTPTPPTDILTTKGVGMLFVAQKDNTTGGTVFQIGGTNFMQVSMTATSATLRGYFGSGKDSGGRVITTGLDTNPHVFWAFYDPVSKSLRCGMDGNETTAAAYSVDLTGVGFRRDVYINNPLGEAKAAIGACQAITKDNLSVADMITLANKMRQHHGLS